MRKVPFNDFFLDEFPGFEYMWRGDQQHCISWHDGIVPREVAYVDISSFCFSANASGYQSTVVIKDEAALRALHAVALLKDRYYNAAR